MTRQLLTDEMRRRLVEAREAKGWTCLDVSKHFRKRGFYFLESTIEGFESGRYDPSFDALEIWCKALRLKLKVEIE